MRRRRSTLLIAAMIGLHAGFCPERSRGAADVLTIVAPAAPGGGWDQTARVMQHVLGAIEPGTSVQVENVPGAAGTIGLARFASAERGNPAALLVTGQVMVGAIVTNGSPVSLAETTPIARLTGEYEVIVVPADSRWRTLADVIGAFTAAPASVAWGGGSAGGTDDLLVRLIAQQVGVPPNQANYIAFPGGGAALAALLGGQVTAGVSGFGEFAGQIAAGTLRMLAVSSPARVAGIDAPTLREQGIALDLANWRGVVAPPGITDVERDRLAARVEQMARSAEWKAVLAKNGWEDLLLTGPAYRQFLLAEEQRIRAVLQGLASSNIARGRALRLTPMTLPVITVALLAILLVVGWATAPPHNRALATTVSTGTVVGPGFSQVFSLLIALLLYSFAMPLIGFIPASAALFAIAARLFACHGEAPELSAARRRSSDRWRRDLVIGLAAAALLYLGFTRGLGLDLPADPITRWLAR